MIRFFNRLRECTSGSALLEATIVFPVVLTLMVGIIDFGRAIQDYHTADKSMRSAARYLARVPAEGMCTWGWDRAQKLAVYGTIDPEEIGGEIVAEPLIQDWTVDTLTLDRDPTCGSAASDPMTLTITAVVPIPTPVIAAIGLPSTINVSVRHEERHIGG